MRARLPLVCATVIAATSLWACHRKSSSGGYRLSESVEVRRDEWGVPHIYAHSFSDSAFVLGYESARDRFFQLDLFRRKVLGREAEWFGSASLDDDRIARTIGFATIARDEEADLVATDPRDEAALKAFAGGVNSWLADAEAGRDGATLPPELAVIDPAYRPEPWRVVDTLALLKAQLFSLAAHPETDLLAFGISATEPDGPDVYRDLYRPDPLEKVYVTAGFSTTTAALGFSPGVSREALATQDPALAKPLLALVRGLGRFTGRHRTGPVGASNNWVVCGVLTSSGEPMLANDPHLDADLPTNFYEWHLESDSAGEPARVAGFGFPGVPAVALGHNDAIAWGVTTVEADIADSYLETLDGTDAVDFNGAVVPMQVHEEAIRVRRSGRPVGDDTITMQKVRVVPHHGPVISDAIPDLSLFLAANGEAITMRWEGFSPTHEPLAFSKLQRARSFAEFRDALDSFQAGLFNFVYAGADGDIGYYPHADYPIRENLYPLFPPYGVMPGSGGYEWTGALIPNDAIPRALDPPACRIWTSNNDPAGVTADGDVLDDPYYLGGTFDYGLRARIVGDHLAALASNGGITIAQMSALQDNVHSGLADHFLPPLLAATSSATLSPTAASMRATLAAWDHEDTIGQTAPAIFYAWYSHLIADVFADDLPQTFSQVGSDDRPFSSVLAHLLAGEAAPSGHDYLGGVTPAQAMTTALEEVAVTIPAALGSDPATWTWGSVHTQTFNHPLGAAFSLGPFPLGGGLASVNAARYAPIDSNGAPAIRADVGEVPNTRIVVTLGSAGNITMKSVLTTGESGVLGDPHAKDQLPLWLAGQLRDSHFARSDVVAHTASVVSYPAGFPAKR